MTYRPHYGWESFGSARTNMQVVFNAVSEDVSISESIEPQWNGFNFAEGEMKRGFERNSFDERWDWDEWFNKFEEVFRIKDPEAHIKRVYKEYAEKYPWLDVVQMTDEELEERITRDLDKEIAQSWLNNGFTRPYDRITINIIKSFYETGEHHLIDSDYINGQLDFFNTSLKN